MNEQNRFDDLFREAENSFEYKLERLSRELTDAFIKIMDADNLSRKQLAERLGISKAAVSALLNNGSNLTLKRLLSIVEALDCTVDISLQKKHAPGAQANARKVAEETPEWKAGR